MRSSSRSWSCSSLNDPGEARDPHALNAAMPQLDVSTYLPQLFWLAVTFFALYLLMKFVALPQVGAAIAARRGRIEEDLAAAASLKSEAQTALAAYEKSLAAARSEAQALIREGAERLAAEAAERHRELAQRLAEEAAAGEREIAAAKERALAEIGSLAPDLARTVVEKLTGSLLSAPGAAAE